MIYFFPKPGSMSEANTDTEQIKTPTPKWVLQVFTLVVPYTKEEKSFEDRKDRSQWNSYTGSSTSQLKVNPDTEETELTLSSEHTFLDIMENDLIVLNDSNDESDFGSIHFYNLNKKHGNIPFSIFKLQKSKTLNDSGGLELELELHLNYNETTIGDPKRENFKIANLLPGKTIEVKVNGKFDFSMTGRRERTYKEQIFRFQLCGPVSSIEFARVSPNSWVKKIPQPNKIIDLMKQLY